MDTVPRLRAASQRADSLRRSILVAIAALALGSAMSSDAAAQEPGRDETGTFRASADYVIGVEDRLEVSVYQEPTLTRTVVVLPDGKISFPLVGDLMAAGRTTREIDEQITEALRAFINEPVVTVVVVDVESFKVFVLGEVARQGVLSLKRRTRLLEAIAQSGGLTAYADKSNVVLVRQDEGRETRLRIDYKKILSGERPDLNVFLKPGDTIIVN